MKTLWCIHGNLQQPDVWQPFISVLSHQYSDIQINAVNLWDTLADSAWTWAREFCNVVQTVSTPATQNYLVGYSLGGRLAMHTLLIKPGLWSRATIVSADPGIADPQLKEDCLRRDRTWANRFLTEPWDKLLREWDALPVFYGRPCLTSRLEANFDRQKIAHGFEAYSKGRMDHLAPQLNRLSLPMAYITGSDDHRYSHIGQTLMATGTNLTHIEIYDAGHRVPWEQPQAFMQVLSQSLEI